MNDTELKCKDKVQSRFDDRMDDIHKLWKQDCEHPDEPLDDLGSLNEYGLCFDYVEPYTFKKQREGFYRWQLSTGGPGDEFRFYVDGDKTIQEIEYWFLDWFDGACTQVEGEDFNLLVEMWEEIIQMTE